MTAALTTSRDLGDELVGLLRSVAVQGWDSDVGAAAVLHFRRICRHEAGRWKYSAGRFTDEGLADVWEAANSLLLKGQADTAPAIVRRVAQRTYAGEAAAAQTGIGSPKTRGLVKLAKSDDAMSRTTPDALDDLLVADGSERPRAPIWMRVVAVMLARAGWDYPIPPLDAVVASAAVIAINGRRRQSPLAAHDTGVPAAAWSGLALLVAGSGPGCAFANRQPGASDIFAAVGAAGVRRGHRDAPNRVGRGDRKVSADRAISLGRSMTAARSSDSDDPPGRSGRLSDEAVYLECELCGELHPGGADCPWDLFAAGFAPHPYAEPDSTAMSADDVEYRRAPTHETPRPTRSLRTAAGSRGSIDAEAASDGVARFVERLDTIVRHGIPAIPEIVASAEDLVSVHSPDGAVLAAEELRSIAEDLLGLASTMPDVAERLCRLADVMEKT